ncbi:MAG: tRNA (cytidine(34)-2'-O)-methyltransferase [Myxococcales bacterium]|nr:tRNA (cytidine(34)-2'-O)-methyltransferase [Myxococcales bacterium]
MDVALVEPEIPGNTGAIGRVCVGTGTGLHLVGQLGFDISDRAVKRAGLDYWPNVDLHVHPDMGDWEAQMKDRRIWLFSTRGQRRYDEVSFQKDDVLVFGRESRGLPQDFVDRHADRVLTLPMNGMIRSLNLANVVTAVVFEALRQQGFPHVDR